MAIFAFAIWLPSRSRGMLYKCVDVVSFMPPIFAKSKFSQSETNQVNGSGAEVYMAWTTYNDICCVVSAAVLMASIDFVFSCASILPHLRIADMCGAHNSKTHTHEHVVLTLT